MRRTRILVAVGLVTCGLLATTTFGVPEKEKTVTLTIKGMT